MLIRNINKCCFYHLFLLSVNTCPSIFYCKRWLSSKKLELLSWYIRVFSFLISLDNFFLLFCRSATFSSLTFNLTQFLISFIFFLNVLQRFVWFKMLFWSSTVKKQIFSNPWRDINNNIRMTSPTLFW